MQAAIAAALVFPAGLFFAQAAPDTTPIGGEWRGGNVIGAIHPQPNGCTDFRWMEWTLELTPLPAKPTEFRGTWSYHLTALWTPPPNIDPTICRFGDEPVFTRASEGVVRQSVVGHFDTVTQTLHLTTRLLDCRGSACKIMLRPPPNPLPPGQSKDTWQQSLTRTGGMLRLQDGPEHWLLLQRTSNTAELLLPPSDIRDAIAKEWDGAKVDAVAARAATGNPATLAQWNDMRNVVGSIAQRIPGTVMLSSYVAPPDTTGIVNTVLFVSQVVTADGRGGTEILILIQQNSEWRIAWLRYL